MLSSAEKRIASTAVAGFKTEILSTDWRDKESITFHSRGGADPLDRVTVSITSKQTQASLDIGATHLRTGELVAFPTETVYGLGANALDSYAIRKIYAAKRRPADNPLIVHVSDLEMLRSLLPAQQSSESRASSSTGSPVYDALVRHFWPGALTLLFSVAASSHTEARLKVANEVTCGHPTLAIRMPSHPLARALIARTGLPLAAPSANASGRPSPTTAAHVLRDLGGQLDGDTGSGQLVGRIKYILDGGPADVGVESTVVDGVTCPGELRVLRPGGVTVEQLAQCLRSNGLLLDSGDQPADGAAESTSRQKVRLRVYGKDLERSDAMESNPTTPGMKYRHYSPSAPVTLLVVHSGRDTEGADRTSYTRMQVSASAPATDPSRPPASVIEAVRGQVDARLGERGAGPGASGSSTVTVGLMSLLDSGLLSELMDAAEADGATLNTTREWMASPGPNDSETATHAMGPPFRLGEGVMIQPFSLGSRHEPHLAAKRLFEGLRALDEGVWAAAATTSPGRGPGGAGS